MEVESFTDDSQCKAAISDVKKCMVEDRFSITFLLSQIQPIDAITLFTLPVNTYNCVAPFLDLIFNF